MDVKIFLVFFFKFFEKGFRNSYGLRFMFRNSIRFPWIRKDSFHRVISVDKWMHYVIDIRFTLFCAIQRQHFVICAER